MEYRKGSIVFDNWQIVRLLGEGANGKVYEIHKTDYGVTTRSALKVIRIPRSEGDIIAALNDGMDEKSVTSYFQGFVQEIIKEVAVMSELKSHSGIVAYEDHKVVAHEETIGWDILIRMELLTSMQEYLASHKMSEAEVLRLGKEICSALEFCQKKAVIHRDIKPENIFVNESGQFKLGDFGIARTIEKTTGGLSKKGTESYMAPEVYRGQPYGSTVDIYSLGLVLYKLMNHGRLPLFPPAPQPILFEDRENALNQRVEGKIFAAPEAAGEEFGEIILKACSYNPKERYHTAAEMGAALEKIAIGDSVKLTEVIQDEDDQGTEGMWNSPVDFDDGKTQCDEELTDVLENEQTVSDIEEKKVEKKLQFPNGEKYDGEYVEEIRGEKKNTLSGMETYYFQDGSKYEGQWKNDKPHGDGQMYDAKGHVTVGKWENGTFVGARDNNGTYIYKNEKQTEKLKNKKILPKTNEGQIVIKKESVNEKRWLKIIIMVVLISVSIISIIGSSSDQESGKTDIPKFKVVDVEPAIQATELGDTWESGTVQIGDKILTLPCEFSELEAAGFYLRSLESEDDIIKSRDVAASVFENSYEERIFVGLINPYDVDKKKKECLVGSIDVDANFGEFPASFIFPGEIKLGSSIEDVIRVYGEADGSIENNEYDYYNYYWQLDDGSSLLIDVDQKTNRVTKITLEMYDMEVVE